MPTTSRPSGPTLIVSVLVALFAAFVLPSTAGATPDVPDGSGWARFGHFAPDETAVDVFVDGEMFVEGVEFKTVSAYLPLPSGPHRFEVRPTGGDDAESILDVEAGVPDGSSITVGAVSTRDGVASQVYTDDLVQPDPGSSLARFIHAAPDVQAVDVVVVGGPTLAGDIPYPAATDYVAIAPGTYDVEVRDAGTDDVVLSVDGWSIEAGVQASIVILRGADGRLDVAPIRDAVSVAVAPAGGIQTGGGAMADVLDPPAGQSMTTTWALLTALAAASVAGAGVLRRHRRSS